MYSEGQTMSACWRYGMLFCNCFTVFGVYYFMEIPTALQSELTNSHNTYIGSKNTGNQTDCKVCLGLGEVRYNLLFSVTRWTSFGVCLPSGFVIDRLGNGRSAIFFSSLVLIGSVLFAVGATSHPPVTTPMYILMVTGYGSLAFGDASLRFVQARVVSHCFPEVTLIAMAFCTFGCVGQGISLFTTPAIATAIGLHPAVWLGPVSCGLGVLCAVGLALLLHIHPPVVAEDNGNKKILTMNVLRRLPVSYWVFLPSIGFTSVCWIVKQANLPYYLELRHGYSMREASRVTGIAPVISLLCPLVCLILNKVDCDGIIYTFFHIWMISFFALLGFCPSVNIIFISLADGIGMGMMTALQWQVIVILCPALYLGTLSGVTFMARNSITALTFIAAGYILQRGHVTSVDETLRHYQHFFLMIIVLMSTGAIFGVVMNIVDIRKGGALNSRIRKWQQSNIEAIGLVSMEEPSKYCGNSDAKESNDYSMN
ncbi:major facilitator superfamily domain-containing protein 1-like [Pecten maximus]|uniref:major facilitator superfamily domain-containing protein 1-like n=1 Tax=Pecten maximus TaxID=6579 RepID=UPI001458CB3A|nr:major facilitator superfamily domain-containing protein 1-like [Pecten maximus]